MTETKEFHVSVVLSALTGRLLAPNGMGDIYQICEFVSGEEGLFTHQLPRVLDEIEPFLKEQFPELAKVEVPLEDMDTFEKIFTWFDLNIYDTYGEMVEVKRMPEKNHTHIDPITELRMKMPNAQIFVIGTEEELEEE